MLSCRASYDDFEGRVAARRNLASGTKQDQVRRYILDHAGPTFQFRDVRAALPGIGDPTIKRVLAAMRQAGAIELHETNGRQASWRRKA
jgi:Fe2+ or Zn2+ uptake regulation protein